MCASHVGRVIELALHKRHDVTNQEIRPLLQALVYNTLGTGTRDACRKRVGE